MSFVGILYICLILALAWSVYPWRKVIRTERTDAVFGNPIRAMGGWHWVVCGVSSLMLFWFTFSWDAGQSVLPGSPQMSCARSPSLNRAANPIRSAYPLDNRYLLGTRLLSRDFKQIDLLYASLDESDFNSGDRQELTEIIGLMRDALAAQANTEYLSSDTVEKFNGVASRIDQLSIDLLSSDFPGPPDEESLTKALNQPAWGESSTEIPALPKTDRGACFRRGRPSHGRNCIRLWKNPKRQSYGDVDDHRSRGENQNFVIDENETRSNVERRKQLLSQIQKISKRVDDLKVFPSQTTDQVETALLKLEDAMNSPARIAEIH